MKPLSPYCVQWEALFLLVAGITINQLRNCPSTGVVEAAVPIVTAGLCVLGSVTVPSAASVREEGGVEGGCLGREGAEGGLQLEECSNRMLHGRMGVWPRGMLRQGHVHTLPHLTPHRYTTSMP